MPTTAQHILATFPKKLSDEVELLLPGRSGSLLSSYVGSGAKVTVLGRVLGRLSIDPRISP